jgi:hypothetical protein
MNFRCLLCFSVENGFSPIFESKIVKNRLKMYLLRKIMNSTVLDSERHGLPEQKVVFAETCIFDGNFISKESRN